MTRPAPASEPSLAAPDPVSQETVTDEIGELHRQLVSRELYGERLAATALDFPAYRSSVLRHPTKSLQLVDPESIELASPAFGQRDVAPVESDLTVQHAGEPLGERMTVRGRLTDSWGRPLANQLVEIWQANSAGRYIHQRDQHPAPLDPHFTGAGRTITDAAGEYEFRTIKPGPYPWRNHVNAWRPAHIHFSVFGTSFTQRLVTQMYFPGDPLFALDPIYNSIWRERDRESLVAVYYHGLTVPEQSTGYRFDIVVDGADATWFEHDEATA